MFDSLSYGQVKDKGAAGSSRCSRGEPSTMCGSASDDDLSLLAIDTTVSPTDDSRTRDKIHVSGRLVSVENHQVSSVADPLQHQSQRTAFVHWSHDRLCQLMQTRIDFHLPVTVIISLTAKVNK